MDEDSDDTPDLEQSARAELNQLRTKTSALVTRALILWAIRWTIGFALIWAITSWSGRFEWLWTAGIVVALISLVVTVSFRIFFARKMAGTVAKLDNLKTVLEEAEREERERGIEEARVQ